ncbi:transglutaminaseTgpA domain-containing protein [Marilutibacter spongiae]|uniref:DUF3488 domain-containing transglutaminase family protein n=1 Tax=Marilutibacter spongiae TaxID=2025720 RepID=A0A7W3Y6N9_9GAMM|nr:DUF3488 domain-containing transglutaminase family protein [Lysobacter spongiae]
MAEGRAPMTMDAASRRWALASATLCLLPLLLQMPLRVGILVAATGLVVSLASWRRRLPGLLRLLVVIGVIGAVFLLAGFNVGRDTGCALLAAMIASKPSETFTLRDGRSLVGFALFAPFATFLLDQGPLSLGLGLAAACVTLLCLQRLSDLEAGVPDAHADPRAQWAGVGRLLLLGLPLALAAFWLFPRLGTPLWGIPDRAMSRPGLSDSMKPGEWVDLMADDSAALRVTFFGDTPPTSQMYWRGPVLWDFDGREWRQPDWARRLPPAPFTPGRGRWDYEMAIEPTDRTLMVSLDLPLDAPEGTQLALDHSLFSARPLHSVSRWRMQSAPPARYQADLPAALRARALALPEGFNPRTLALARQWRRDAGRDDAALVDRSLQWIRREFAYTLTTPLPGRHSVDEFLFDQKAGFCEHFSSAFVVLMRGAGIPARVVTGYTGGYFNRLGGYWLVRRNDAHAWAEVWLAGRGWVRVDPTAAVAPERIYDTLDDRIPGADGLLGGLAGMGSAFEVTDWLRQGWNDLVLGFDADRQSRLLRPLGIRRLQAGHMIGLFALSACLALAWMTWLSLRGERPRDPVLRAWHRLGRRYARMGLEREAHEPAEAWAERVAGERPDLGPALQELSHRFADWRYACPAGGTERDRDRKAARKQLVRALRSHRPQRRRDPGEQR